MTLLTAIDSIMSCSSQSVRETSPLSPKKAVGKAWWRGAMLWSSTSSCFSVLKAKEVKVEEREPKR